MISQKLLIVLAIGTVAMCVPILLQSAWYQIKLWKSIPIAVVLTVTGTLGTYIMYFIESGKLGGRSFYGAVFLVPLVFLLFAKLICVPYGDLMDLCAPAECMMLAIMKFQCFTNGCCGGRTLFTAADGTAVVFPSQIVELVNALILLAMLLLISRKVRFRGTLYLWYLVIYGGTRFVLNIFREEWITTDMFIPFGNIWSLVAMVVGINWLILLTKKKHNISTLS